MAKNISYNRFVHNTILFSIIAVISIFSIYGFYFKSNSIEKNIKNDTQIMADLVFQNLYSVMKHGGNLKDIDDTINHLENSVPHINIQIIRNKNKTNKDIVNHVFETKKIEIARDNDNINFASPILYKNECLSCHIGSKIDDVAGVVQIEHPILELKIPLKEILIMAIIFIVIILIVFFSTWYHVLNKYFVKPITNLAMQIDKSTSHHDLDTNIKINTKIKEIKYLERSFNNQNKELKESYQKIVEQSNTDSLTKTFNRKKFDEYSLVFFNDAKRFKHIFTLILIDINKFKPINDTYGHDVGDKVLIFFSKIISKLIRESDFFFRTGGDEFILILPSTNYNESIKLIQKIKNEFKNNIFEFSDLKIELSASFGISEYNESIVDINDMVKIADKRMYEDKKTYETP